MERAKGFGKRVTIDEVKQRREAAKVNSEASKAMDIFAHMIDEETDKAVVEVIRSLGYKAEYGMPLEEAQKVHKEMQDSGLYLNIATEQNGTDYKVTVSVVQMAKELIFDLSVEEEN